MMTDRLINLSIATAGGESGEVFTFHLRVGGAVIASNQALTLEQSQQVRDLSRQYGGLFERRQAPKIAEDALAAIGSELFSIWLAPFWEELTAGSPAGASREMVISSASAEVLNLPWELLRIPGADAIGTDGKWILRRLPEAEAQLGPAPQDLPPGPLRVLYMVSAPMDQAELDYEKEEELLLRALSRAGHEVVFDSGDLGSFEELEERIADFRPHVVHLTGHGVARNDAGFFAFEDEHGATDLRSASEIGQLFAGQGVQCAFISACQAGKAPDRNAQNGLAQGLLAQGVPLVIGWTASILDDVATEVGGRFYREVANGQTTIDRALISARQHARRLFAKRSDPSWSLPVLYAATRQGHLFDSARSEPRLRSSLRLEALPGMSEEGFTPHFIGRRRELQELLPALRAGAIQLTILTGLGGAGKSTLATRLARKLEADGWTPIAMSSSDDVPLTAAALLETCGDAFLIAGLESAHARLRAPELPTAERLRHLVNTLNEHRFVLLLDNFESNIDEASRKILDSEISAFYKYLLARLQGKSRAIVTSRYLPSDASLPQRAREWQLGEFGEAAFLKFMLRDPTVEKRYREGDLSHDLLVRLHSLLGGTPRFLGQIRKLLETIAAEELRAELDKVVLPAEQAEAPGVLQAARDAYCQSIFTSRLYARLPAQAQQMLRRLAVLNLAIPVDGLAAIGGLTEAEAQSAAEAATQVALLHRASADRPLWSVYGTLRGWLLAPERIGNDERRAAHLAAGNYLREIDRQDREEELGLNFIACRQEMRGQFLAGESWEDVRQVTSALSRHYSRQGLYDEIFRINNELLGYEEHPATTSWIGASYIDRAEYGKAREWYERSLKLAQSEEGSYVEAMILHQLATVDMREGDYRGAREKLQQSLKIKQQTGAEVASTWHQLATIDIREGDYPAAREKLQRSLELSEETGGRSEVASTWHQLATIDMYEGDYPAAREKLGRALDIRQQVGDRAGQASAWHQLGTIDIDEGDYPAARQKFVRSLEINQQIGGRAGEASTWHQLATIDIRERAYPAAREKLGRALESRRQIGDRAGEASSLHQLGSIDLHEGDLPAAREKFARSVEISQQIGGRVGEASTWLQLASIDIRENNLPAAREKVERSLEINRQIGRRAGEAAAWHQLSVIDIREGDYPAALDKLPRSLAINQQIGDRANEASTWYQLGWLMEAQGHGELALRLKGLCWIIDSAIGHRDAKSDLEAVAGLAETLGYEPETLEALMQEVAESYVADRGASLLGAIDAAKE